MSTPSAFRLTFSLSGTVPRALTTTGITFALTPHILPTSLARSSYFSTFSSSFSQTLLSSGIATVYVYNLAAFLLFVNDHQVRSPGLNYVVCSYTNDDDDDDDYYYYKRSYFDGLRPCYSNKQELVWDRRNDIRAPKTLWVLSWYYFCNMNTVVSSNYQVESHHNGTKSVFVSEKLIQTIGMFGWRLLTWTPLQNIYLCNVLGVSKQVHAQTEEVKLHRTAAKGHRQCTPTV